MLPVTLQAYADEFNRRRASHGLGALAWESAAAAVAQRAADRMAVAGQVEHPNVGECVIAGASWYFQPGQLFDLWAADFGNWSWLYSPTATRFGLAVTGSSRGWWYWAGVFDGLPAPLGSPGTPALRPMVGRPAIGSWAEWVRRVAWWRAARR